MKGNIMQEMWTAKTIEDYCKTVCFEYFNMEFDCSVSINPRLTRTLGRVTSKWVCGKYRPIKMEFSMAYIECATYESVQDVIKHELCHYVATKKDGCNHGHDRYFKSLCRKIGCVNDGTKNKKSQYNKPMPKKEPKYIVECECCGNKNKYYRKCNVIKYTYMYSCGKCGSDNLKVELCR